MAGCPDCLEYSTALHHSLPRLLGPAEQDAQCKLHGYVSLSESLLWLGVIKNDVWWDVILFY